MAATEVDSLRFEVGFGSYPATALTSISWTDVTSDVRLADGVSFNRGRSSQDDAPSPGTLSLTLNNGQASGKSVGRWTMGGSSVTAGWVLRVPIRVRHTTHGVLWLGYVDSTEAGWDGGVRPVVRVRASDRLARFARRSLLSLSVGAVLNQQVSACYPLAEAAGATSAGDVSIRAQRPLVTGQHGTGGVVEFGSVESPTGEAVTAADFARVSARVGKYLTAPFQFTSPLSGDWSIGCLVRPNAGATGTLEVMSLRGPTGRLNIYYDSATGFAGFADFTSPGLTLSAVPGLAEAADRWYSVILTCEYATGFIRLYVDGVETGNDSGAVPMWTPDQVCIGGSRMLAYDLLDGAVCNAWVAEYAIFTAIPEVSDSVDGYDADTGVERWQRICDVAGLDPSDTAVTGSALPVPNTATQTPTMGQQQTAGVPFLDALQACADVEGGVSFLARTGVLTLQRGATRFNAAVAVTLGPNDVQSDLAVAYDTDRLVNEVVVSRVGGATQRVINQGSISEFDVQSRSLALYASDDAQGPALAGWIVYAQGDPSDPRIDSVSVDIVAKAATITESALLTADLSSRLQLTSMPTPAAPTATTDLFVEGIADSIGVGTWRRTYTTSSATKASAVFIFNDATFGRFDTGGVLI